MPRMRVKDMSRQQQKAVFAGMGNRGIGTRIRITPSTNNRMAQLFREKQKIRADFKAGKISAGIARTKLQVVDNKITKAGLPQTQSQDVAADIKKYAPKEFKKLKDSDKDKTPDVLDSKKFDPKKQSFLHDFQVRRIKKQEAKLEKIRMKKQQELEQTLEDLKERRQLSEAKAGIKQAELARKQAVINEIEQERAKLKEIAEANKQAKKDLAKYTFAGKFKRGVATTARGVTRAVEVSTKVIKQADDALDKLEGKKKK